MSNLPYQGPTGRLFITRTWCMLKMINTKVGIYISTLNWNVSFISGTEKRTELAVDSSQQWAIRYMWCTGRGTKSTARWQFTFVRVLIGPCIMLSLWVFFAHTQSKAHKSVQLERSHLLRWRVYTHKLVPFYPSAVAVWHLEQGGD